TSPELLVDQGRERRRTRQDPPDSAQRRREGGRGNGGSRGDGGGAKPPGGRPARRPPQRSSRPVIPFALGLALGYGLAGPLPSLIGPALAGLLQGGSDLGRLVPPLWLGQGRIVILGTYTVAANTDVMLNVQLGHDRTTLTQVPRDTFIESDRYGVLKANALYATGGIEAVKAELGRLLGTPPDHYVIVNLEAVQHAADALGGVEVDVPKRMAYVDNAQGLIIDLWPGRQVLRGNDLEGFLRFRHDELGDLGRMERQRLVINRVFSKLASPATLAQLPALLKIAGEDIHTDLSPLEITQLLGTMAHTRLSTQRLPGRESWEHDLSYWMPASNATHPSGNGDVPSP
ncbi:MAG: LCP family protein, partial [Cyanobium sp.]